MEVEIEPTFLHVTWTVKDFLELTKKDDVYLDSPEFLFCGNSYSLRLYPAENRSDESLTKFALRRLSATFPKREVCYKIGVRWSDSTGDVWNDCLRSVSEQRNAYALLCIRGKADQYLVDGNLIIVCTMRLSEESRGTSAAEEEEEEDHGGFPAHDFTFLSRWSLPNMELSTESPCTYVYLTVPVFDLSREIGDSVTSPEFQFAGDAYHFRFCPKDSTVDSDFQLVRLTSTFPERTVTYSVGYWWKGCQSYSKTSRLLVNNIGSCIPRSRLEKEKFKYVRVGTLRLFLLLRLGEQDIPGAGTQKRNRLSRIRQLQSDFRQLLQKGTESNACFVVRGKEFKVHKNVVRARSAVFEAMFSHDTTEKESGRVVVDDLDPDSFGDFLEYLYTGDVQGKLSDDNVFGLYVAADKYDVSTLKSECVDYMRRTLSVDSVCDVMTLALRHCEEDLLQQAISFFEEHLQHIITTPKWQQFMNTNSASANELFMKALIYGNR